MSNSDKKAITNKPSEQEIEQLYRDFSQEKTKASFDKDIMQMAKEHLHKEQTPKGEAKKKWFGFINAKSLKYPFSLAAALVVTLGIARFMAHLGGSDVSRAQKAEGMIAMEVEQAPNTAFSDTVTFEMIAERRKAATEAKEEQEVFQVSKSERDRSERLNLVAKKELAKKQKGRLLASSEKPSVKEQVRTDEEAEYSDSEVVVTGARIASVNYDKDDSKQNAPKLLQESKLAQKDQGSKVKESELADLNKDIGNSVDEISSGVLDEAVPGYPLPEVWLEEINGYLKQKDEINALDQWKQFKSTYPDYKVSEQLLEQIQSLQKLKQND